MNNPKKDRRDDERKERRGPSSRTSRPTENNRTNSKPNRRDSEGRAERKQYGSRDAGSNERGARSSERGDRKPYSRDTENRSERKPYGSRERGDRSAERGDRKPYSRETENRSDRKPYGSKDAEGSSERKPYRNREAESNERGARSSERNVDRRGRNEGSFERSSKKYNSDRPKRKSNTSRTPAPKPGPFDKFDVQKMREAKAESLEKKERKRPSRRDAEERIERKPYDRRSSESRERGAGSYERGSRENRPERKEYGARSTERGTGSRERIVRKERSFDKAEGEKSFEQPARENRSEKSFTKKESVGFERKKTNPEDEIRLNRYIANSGVCSRRKADELIEKGEVTVNGEVVRELGYKVKYSDKIKFEGKLLKPGKLVYVLLNKPKDYITTMDDPMERRTVVDLTAKVTNERIFPVGRLDRNTTGLLLLTNDGDLADKLSHPRNQVKKVYEVELDKSLIAKDFEKVRDGVELEDGPAKVDMISYLDGKSKKFVGVEIHIGRNRIVRRIFESLGYEVVRLDRVIYAGLTKKDLPRGRSRILTKEEIIYLKHLNKY